MINPAPPAGQVVVAATPVSNDPNLPPPEVGVYWKNGFAFARIEGQAISQAKVGGKAGSMFTYGLRNEHWDAYLDGPQSKNVVSDRQAVFYIYVPDGGSAADFALIILEKKGNRREFQIGSFGGITGGKSGVKREKEIAFTAEHVGIRMYKLKLEAEMKPGEYAFFMGTGQQATMAGGSSGGARSGGKPLLGESLRLQNPGVMSALSHLPLMCPQLFRQPFESSAQLNPELPQVMIEMLAGQRGPFFRCQRSKESVRGRSASL